MRSVLHYVIKAIVGYLVFGTETVSHILSNLQQDGLMGKVVIAVKLLYVVSVLCSYTVIVKVLVIDVERTVSACCSFRHSWVNRWMDHSCPNRAEHRPV